MTTGRVPGADGSGTPTLIDVALPLPVRRSFTYSLQGPAPAPGTRVLVPFRNRTEVGWVVGPGDRVPGIRAALAVLEESPSVSKELLNLGSWLAEYYVASLGSVLKSMLPSCLVDRSRDYVTLQEELAGSLSAREERIIRTLEVGVPRSVLAIRRTLGKGSFWPELRALTDRGVLTHQTVPPKDPAPKTRRMVRLIRWIEDLGELEDVFGRAAKQREAYEALADAGGVLPLASLLDTGYSRSVVAGVVDRGIAALEDEEVIRDPFAERGVDEEPVPTPTTAQHDVVRRLVKAAEGSEAHTFLLHGITGSGKTLVYSEFLRRIVSKGQGAIVLVPEIALTPQTVARFRQTFGDTIAVLHSGLSDGERFDAWRQLREGHRRIAIGARSAVFAPVANLGAIIVDEEHDGSYKQGEAPRYNGRDVAVVRARLCGAVCVLGSATPSLESWTNAQEGKYSLLSLPERVGGGVLPDVRVLDLRRPSVSPESQTKPQVDRSRSREAKARDRILTPPLVDALSDRLHRGEQSILLLNRRGYASFAMCEDCGEVTVCHQCSVSLTYHRGKKELVCHHCGHVEPPPQRCGRCGSRDISFKGLGTEQVERLTGEALPAARIARMDVDTTGGKWAHHEILSRVGRGEVDILLGTQMIAKGLDFPKVTLVGVINADVGLHLPDFRASERTFQLLAQVAGRAGRSGSGGEVIVQTYVPEHYVIRAALGHDYRGFVDRELQVRREPVYPPHVRMARILMSSPDQRDALKGIDALGRWIRQRGLGVDVLGPAPAPIERLHGRYRFHVLLRSPQPGVLGRALRTVADEFRPSGTDVRLSIDRDPLHLL